MLLAYTDRMQNLQPPNISQKKSNFYSKTVVKIDLSNATHHFKIVVSAIFCSYMLSCAPVKNQVYFENLKKDTTLRNVISKDYDIKIQKNDILGISVASLSPDVAFYNASQATASAASGGNAAPAASSGTSYNVDKDGNINFIKLGTLHVEGKTRKEVKDTLERGLIPYLKDVVVSVSFLNRHVTMLGAISSQVPLVADNMTLLDALAAGGDIGEKGKIDNILVIREKDNDKVFKRISLKDNSIFYSPYFYLQPDDIIYIEPKVVKAPISTAQIISYVTAGISLVFLILNNFFK